MYIERQREFEIVLREEIIPIFKSLKRTLNRVSEGDKELIDNIFDYIDFDLLFGIMENTYIKDRYELYNIFLLLQFSH